MQEILQQLTWIKSATSPHDVVDRVMAAVGFTDDDYVCIAMFDDDAPVMAHRVPPSFLEVFVERRLYEHCPGIEHARRVSTPFNYFDAPVSSAEGRADLMSYRASG
jgi:Autoinducer binding domain